MATIRRNLAQQSISHGDLAGLFEEAAWLAAAELLPAGGRQPAAAEPPAGGTASSSAEAEWSPLPAAANASWGEPQQPLADAVGRGIPASATPSIAAGPPCTVADAHAAALQQVLSAVKAAQPGSLVPSPLAASSLPAPAIRGPSQQLEAAFSAAEHTAAASSPALRQPGPNEALLQPVGQEQPPPSQQRPPQPPVYSSFEQRILAAARGRSDVTEGPTAAASVQPSASTSDAAEAYTRSSSAKTVLVVAQRASASEPAGGSSKTAGPSYEAALTSADAVARELSALMHQQPQEGEVQQLQGGSCAAQSSVDEQTAGSQASDEHRSPSRARGSGAASPSGQEGGGHAAAGSLSGSGLVTVSLLHSSADAGSATAAAGGAASVRPASASPAATSEAAAWPAAVIPDAWRPASTGHAGAGSAAATSPATCPSPPATATSPASRAAQPAAACSGQPASPDLARRAVTCDGSPAATGHRSSGPASPGSEQWDVLLDELAASTLTPANDKPADSSAPGQQLGQQAQGSSSPAADEAVCSSAVRPTEVGLAAVGFVAEQEQQLNPEAGPATSTPGSSSSGRSPQAGSHEAALDIPAASSEPAGLAQRSLPPRLLRRLATHMQHDSVGSVAGEEHAAAAASEGQGASAQTLSAAGLLQPPPDATAAQLAAAAQAADLAQCLLNRAHAVLQREAAGRQADAAAAEHAAVAAEARLEGMHSTGAIAADAAGAAAR